MLSPTATQKQGDQVNQTPVMSGPYKVDEWVPKDHITVSRWDGYKRRAPWSDHDGPGYLDKVIWKFIPEARHPRGDGRVRRDADGDGLTPQDLPRLQSQGCRSRSKPWVGMPVHDVADDDPAAHGRFKVRQAIEYGSIGTRWSALYQGIGTEGDRAA